MFYLLITIFGFLASPASDSCAASAQTAVRADHESPFACNRLALNSEERTRHFDELGPMLLRLRTDVHELADGYAFDFPSDTKSFALVSEWVEQERRCCPFFDIDIRVHPEGGPLTLSLTGRKGTKEFIEADGKDWIKK
ncbi:MAG TPA: hypothetical protein VN380_17485 [Thermoanaerobaculia bacterium]|jgi:hypothetical protein|nr:hypothetical protein [Thermoanaerobaculia bacterium]